jgi:protein-S-isoprenylcysteine O-methyltransferase Ste14
MSGASQPESSEIVRHTESIGTVVSRPGLPTPLRAALGLVNLVAVVALALFGAAGTLHFFEAWLFLGVFTGSALAITLYLALRDPALLARRTQAGPTAEKRWPQKAIQGLASIAFIATLVVPALDRRLGWSRAPVPLALAGDALVFIGFLAVFLVFRANTFTSAVIEVATEQRVVDTGPYAFVRHPMYAGALVLIAGTPLALGSLVGLLTFPPFLALLVARILDEERFLAGNLAGYADYRRKVRWRLVPHLW